VSLAISVVLNLLYYNTGNEIYNILQSELPIPMMYFICGSFLYFYFMSLRKHSHILITISVVFIMFNNMILKITILDYLQPIFVAFIIIYIVFISLI